ncbi:hypothetical protein [Glycomyces artemisiae]|uniref:Secreted protein n=1 Tax=Glycomyces artemisiae TaxID=1076443 RepID=A0A2T0UDD9_9ACTN|nr:hypothetical protein [Glycomyces artemisiae]PRY55956.1 hypothetical protein B0I28_11162 [Glycomyces artemisiae]
MLRTRLRRAVTAALIGTATAGLLAIGSAAPAAAQDVSIMDWPTGCTYQVQKPWGAVAKCDHANGGSYAASVTCKDNAGEVYEADGAWRRYGWSYAYCPGSSSAQYAGIWKSAIDHSRG